MYTENRGNWIGIRVGYSFNSLYSIHAYLLYMHLHMHSYSLYAKYLSAVSVNIDIATDTN